VLIPAVPMKLTVPVQDRRWVVGVIVKTTMTAIPAGGVWQSQTLTIEGVLIPAVFPPAPAVATLHQVHQRLLTVLPRRRHKLKADNRYYPKQEFQDRQSWEFQSAY